MTPAQLQLFGHPISHSLSPEIHAQFAQQTGIHLIYRLCNTTPDDFPNDLRRFLAGPTTGANITLPHKYTASRLIENCTQRALHAGAVNTIARLDGKWIGDNTDGVGLVRDILQRAKITLADAQVLLIGAGGAAAGVAPALLDAGIAQLVVTNRSLDKAKMLAERLHDQQQRVTAQPLHLLSSKKITPDIIINATSAARSDNADDLAQILEKIAPAQYAIDLNYSHGAHVFLQKMSDIGVRHSLDGLGMLVEQAAESFFLWFGKYPNTDPVYTALRAKNPLCC